ncbi:type III PLP-dependent enzyme, partial [Alphaproteobacteria bacterium]|nr:type III PLP-dependent enzyme [Alphaproteobacteria bacterium]
GLVTYAVKANPIHQVVETLVEAGMSAFDVASLAEIELIKQHSPSAALHYNNPIRSRTENRIAFEEFDVRSFSVDCLSELKKLSETVGNRVGEVEASVRFHLDLGGAGYDFGTKFGATHEAAVELAQEAAQLGFKVSLAFHPGSQCRKAEAYGLYILAAAEIARSANVDLFRLNVGGGFPVDFPLDDVDALEIYMTVIKEAVVQAFADRSPELLCEPGRAMVASSTVLLTKVKAIKEDGRLYLNDGVYGGFQESHIIRMLPRYEVFSPDAAKKTGVSKDFTVFGPTCDSLDQLPGKLDFPTSIEEEDIVAFYNMGAYGSATTTDFNGYRSDNYRAVANFD